MPTYIVRRSDLDLFPAERADSFLKGDERHNYRFTTPEEDAAYAERGYDAMMERIRATELESASPDPFLQAVAQGLDATARGAHPT